MDYGNISSSGNDEADIVEDLYRYQYASKIDLPLDIAGKDGAADTEDGTQSITKDLDLSVLYKALYPRQVLNDRTNDKIWTFDSVLSDLEDALRLNKSSKVSLGTMKQLNTGFIGK